MIFRKAFISSLVVHGACSTVSLNETVEGGLNVVVFGEILARFCLVRVKKSFR